MMTGMRGRTVSTRRRSHRDPEEWQSQTVTDPLGGIMLIPCHPLSLAILTIMGGSWFGKSLTRMA